MVVYGQVYSNDITEVTDRDCMPISFLTDLLPGFRWISPPLSRLIIFVPVFEILTKWLCFRWRVGTKARTYSLICNPNRLDKQRVSSIPSLINTDEMHGLERDSYSGVCLGLERWFCWCITRSSVSFALTVEPLKYHKYISVLHLKIRTMKGTFPIVLLTAF